MHDLDPSTGPVPRDVFVELVNAPFGEATKRIRKYDPLYGRGEGEVVKWTVRVEQMNRREGTVEVEASNEEEAKRKARELDSDDVDWDCDDDDFKILSVTPQNTKDGPCLV